MITSIKIENFKKLESISFPLSSSVVIVGHNNSGKMDGKDIPDEISEKLDIIYSLLK